MSENTQDREIIITRLINSPREVVWEAWTNPEHLIKWWGPKGFTNTFKEISVKPGGVWLFIMHGPDGTDYLNKVVYDEVIQPEKLVYTHGDGSDDHSNDFQSTVTFEEDNGKTKLTMKAVFPSAAILKDQIERVHAIEGGNQTLDRLQEYVAKMSA